MIIKRKTQIILALMLTSIFLFQNCATFSRGTSQKIPVTSSPLGAKIIVDGEEIGYTPLHLKVKKNLKLKRKKGHIIRIEKQGYNPLEIRITRKSSGSLVERNVGNMILAIISASSGAVVYYIGDPGVGINPFWPILIGVGVGLTLVDFLSGANYTLSPTELNVTLTKIKGNAQPNLIIIDAEQFRNIKWIRIRCAYSDGKDS